MTNVALFIDYENIHWTAINDYKHYPSGDVFARLFSDIAKERGQVLICNAYADWSFFNDMQSALASYGVSPVYVASKLREAKEKGARKNSADIQMTIDVMDTLHLRKEIEAYVFFTGDRDFLGVIQRVRKDGKRVIVSGFQTSMSRDIARAANEVVVLDAYTKWSPVVHLEEEQVEICENWKPLIRRLVNLERLPSVHWHYLRKVMYWDDLKPAPASRSEQDDYLNRAKESGIIHVRSVPNPGPDKDNFPTVSAVFLNKEHPQVQKILNEINQGK